MVLDPGHGGTDSGAVGNGLQEKDLTLKIAKYCTRGIRKYSCVTVYMTRSMTDTLEINLEMLHRICEIVSTKAKDGSEFTC